MSPRKKLGDNEAEFIKGEGLKGDGGDATQLSSKEEILSRILKPASREPKDPTVRFTADLPVELHRRLSFAAAKAGKSKVELVREFLDAILPPEE